MRFACAYTCTVLSTVLKWRVMSHLSPNQLASMAGLSARQVQRHLKAGEISSSFRTRGGHWRIPEADGRAWAEKMRREPEPFVPTAPAPCPGTAEEFIAGLPGEVARLSREIEALYYRLWQAGVCFVADATAKGMDRDDWQPHVEKSLGLDYWPVYRAMRLSRISEKWPPKRDATGQFRELVGAVLPKEDRAGRTRPRQRKFTAHQVRMIAACATIDLPGEDREMVLDAVHESTRRRAS